MSIVLQRSSERWKNCCWMCSWWMRAGFSPSPSLTLLSHEDQRGQRKSDNNCVLWSSHCFHLPSQSCCSSESILVWYGLFCFKTFWKKNKVVELCGLITTHGLDCACSEAVAAGQLFIYDFCSFVLSFRINHHQLMLAFPTPVKFMQFIWLVLLSYMHSFIAINSQRGLFSPWPL